MIANLDELRAAAASLHERLNPPGTFSVGVAMRLSGDRPGLDVFLTEETRGSLPSLYDQWEGFPVETHVLRAPSLHDGEQLR